MKHRTRAGHSERPLNFASPETTIQSASISSPQMSAPQSSELLIAPPPTNQTAEFTIPSTSAPVETLRQIQPRTTKRARKSPKYFGFDNDDSSGESSNSFPPNLTETRRKCRADDTESVQHSVVQTIANTADQVEPIYNLYPSPVIGEVSPTDPLIRPAEQSPTNELVIVEEDMYFKTRNSQNLIHYYLWLAMITSKYIVDNYLTGEQVIIYKQFCY